jgi:hypothetical protein
MAILNTPKAFEKNLIQGQVGGEISPFIDYVNQNFDQIIRAFFNQLTLGENLRGTLLNISTSNNTPTNILAAQNPAGILILKSTSPLKSYTTTVTSDGILQATFTFDEALPVKARSVAVSAPFATYEIEGLSTISQGDEAEFSLFGNKLNNGTFLVLYRTENLVTVYNPNAAAETKSSFTGTRESTKVVTLFALT